MPDIPSPIFFSDRDSAALLGVCLTLFRDHVRAKRIPPPVKMGRRSLWPRSDIEAFASRLIEQRNAAITAR